MSSDVFWKSPSWSHFNTVPGTRAPGLGGLLDFAHPVATPPEVSLQYRTAVAYCPVLRGRAPSSRTRATGKSIPIRDSNRFESIRFVKKIGLSIH